VGRDPARGACRLPAELARVDALLDDRSAGVEGLNEALLAKAAEAKLLRCTRVRVDTMVVPANVAYPTDSGLLARAVRRIAATGRRIQAAGGAARNAAAREEAMAVVRRKNGELADPAEVAAGEAERLEPTRNALRNARQKAGRAGRNR
jgi:IS5 family transposase